jgi:hypothetical protein
MSILVALPNVRHEKILSIRREFIRASASCCTLHIPVRSLEQIKKKVITTALTYLAVFDQPPNKRLFDKKANYVALVAKNILLWISCSACVDPLLKSRLRGDQV